MGHVKVTSFWEGVLLMLKNMQAIANHISDSITVILVVLALVHFIYGTFTRLLEGKYQEANGKAHWLFEFSNIIDIVLYSGKVLLYVLPIVIGP